MWNTHIGSDIASYLASGKSLNQKNVPPNPALHLTRSALLRVQVNATVSPLLPALAVPTVNWRQLPRSC
jgi:hypothetical protein